MGRRTSSPSPVYFMSMLKNPSIGSALDKGVPLLPPDPVQLEWKLCFHSRIKHCQINVIITCQFVPFYAIIITMKCIKRNKSGNQHGVAHSVPSMALGTKNVHCQLLLPLEGGHQTGVGGSLMGKFSRGRKSKEG